MNPEYNVIHTELMGLGAERLSAVPPTPFSIPEGYFDTLPDTILNDIRIMAVDDVMPAATRDILFQVPEGYFDQLAANVLEKVHAADQIIEKNEISWGRIQHPYDMPEGYFERMLSQVMTRIHDTGDPAAEELEQLSPFLKDLKHHNPFDVPAGYFEMLHDLAVIISREAAPENPEPETISPLLAGLKQANPFSVPEGYFESAPRVPAGTTGNRVPFKRPGKRRIWIGRSIAAAVLAVVGFMGWRMSMDVNTPSNNLPKGVNTAMAATSSSDKYEKQLASVSKDKISQYVESHIDEFEEVAIMNVLVSEHKSMNANALLNNVSNEQIQAYLEGDM